MQGSAYNVWAQDAITLWKCNITDRLVIYTFICHKDRISLQQKLKKNRQTDTQRIFIIYTHWSNGTSSRSGYFILPLVSENCFLLIIVNINDVKHCAIFSS